MQVQIRRVVESDLQAISDVVTAAFGPVEGPQNVQLITELLTDMSAQPVLSLVATAGQAVLGYVLFTKVSINSSAQKISAAILAPLAVHSDFQSQGVGTELVKEGLRQLVEAGVGLVFVLGHPSYYPRFGFSEAGIRGFDPPYPIPPENAGAWMVKALRPGIIGYARGKVICANSLNDPKYWRE